MPEKFVPETLESEEKILLDVASLSSEVGLLKNLVSAATKLHIQVLKKIFVR